MSIMVKTDLSYYERCIKLHELENLCAENRGEIESKMLDIYHSLWYDYLTELRYNPYHDPSNGRFTSGGGGGGSNAYLYVEKGQKGNGVYVVDKDKYFEKAPAPQAKTVRNKIINSNADYNVVNPLINPLTTDEIIEKVGGLDMTNGSCSSLAFAYIGNKSGLDVQDFRGGDSQKIFASSKSIEDIAHTFNGEVERDTNDFRASKKLLNSVVEGKEYYFTTGSHATIIRKTSNGLEYLELQETKKTNGFKPLTDKSLKSRFGAQKSHTSHGFKLNNTSALIDSDNFKNNSEFKYILGYINTPTGKQMKG